MLKNYYHCSRLQLQPGALILPGNYGNIISHTGPEHPHWIREQFLESYRKQFHPTKPSRLNACFVIDKPEACELYFKHHHLPTDSIYSVQIVDEGLEQHIGDYNCVDVIPGKLETLDQVANHYWNNTFKTSIQGYSNISCMERLTLSPLKVISKAYPISLKKSSG